MISHDAFDIAQALFETENAGQIFRVRPALVPGGAELAPRLTQAFGVEVADLAVRQYLLVEVSWNWEVRDGAGWRDLVRTEGDWETFQACLRGESADVDMAA